MQELAIAALIAACLKTAQQAWGTPEELREAWAAFVELCRARRWGVFLLPEVLAFSAWLEEHGHPIVHHHHHDHAGHVHEETKAEPDDLTKLRILLPHWIEHNEEHAASFERWVARARAVRWGETAQHIEEAVERMAACNQALRAALEALEG